uniref:E3 ubiquitin-protein ligase TRIM39-like n=1 Tax=Euleptes europaea TaxID=460621 RepID=UPI002540EA1E|nr:E3 ubiquitin-protein ligase TRIM39-like [Euleptes europaea]
MAVERSRGRPWAEAICTICGKYFTDPVSLECGHDFCRSCITRCWEELHADIVCPRMCLYFIEGRNFEPNRELADFVEATKQLVERVREEAKGWANCAEHRKPLNLFCEDNQTAICALCKKSEAHRNHCVVGVDFPQQISAYMKVPNEMRNNFTIYLINSEKITEEWLKRMEAERKKTMAKFKHLRQFLNEQENLRLAKLVELEKEIMRKMEEYDGKVSDQKNFLLDVYERMWDLNTDREFLQDFGGGLCSYEKQLENPLPLPIDVKDKVQKFCDRKLFLEEVQKEFNDEMAALLKGRRKRRRTEVVEERGNRVNVILDEKTATNDQLILSADRRTMRYVMDFRPNKPRRMFTTSCVLGSQAFTSGRHWWEVKVEGNGRCWAIGVARGSLEGNYPHNIWDAAGIWVVGKQSVDPMSPRRLLAYSYPRTTVLILTRKPEKIRVCLDYPGGQVAFFNAETDESIVVFRSCSFLGEKVRPLFWLFAGKVTMSC